MSADQEEQEDELLALHSILGSEEFARDETKFAGEIRVSVELPADFSVALKEGETLTQYEMSFLPPLLLTFELPEDYPSSSPPSFTLTCSWLTPTQLSALGAQLTDLYQANGATVVLFTWIQFLREDALKFLDIQTMLELPSDAHSTQDYSQDSLHAAEPKSSKQTPESDWSSTSSPADQLNSTSHDSKGSRDTPNPEPKADHPESSNDSEQISEASEVTETLQTSQFSAAGKSKPPPVAQSDQSGENEGSVSASSLVPSSSAGPLDETEQGAVSLPIQPRESPPNEDRTLSGLSLTPAQRLLSRLLIYDAIQKQKQFATTVFDCGVCFTSWLGSDCVQLPECGHVFCKACLGRFCKVHITEGAVQAVGCPQAGCTATPTPAQVRSLVGEELFSRYDRLLLQNTLDSMPDVVYCPRRSCGSAVIQDKSSNAAMCSVCSFAFCVACRKTYHGTDDCRGNTVKRLPDADAQQGSLALPQSQEGIKALWDDYASGSKQRRHLLESRYGRRRLQFTVEEYLSEDWLTINSKNCPYCFSRIQKDGGCDFMTCSQCRRQFCWATLAKFSS